MLHRMTDDDRTQRALRSIRKQIGQNVRAELVRAGVERTRAADVLNLSRAAIGRRISGKVGFEAAELVLIAADLGLPAARMIDVTAQPTTGDAA